MVWSCVEYLMMPLGMKDKRKCSVSVKDLQAIEDLENAILEGNHEKFETLVSRMEKQNINLRNKEGRALIHIAASENYDAMVKLLLAKGANINCQDHEGNTCLHLAAKNNCKAIVDILIASGANLDIQKRGGYTAISEALHESNFDIYYMLQNAGADTNITDDKNYTLMHTACKVGFQSIVEKIMVENKAAIKAETETKVTPLHEAVKYGHMEIVKLLVKNGVNVNLKVNCGYTPLHTAVRNNHLELVEYLLDSGANINDKTSKGDTVLHIAAHFCTNFEMLQYLIKKNKQLIYETNCFGFTALHSAISSNNLDTVISLVNLGADTRAQTVLGTVPLELAVIQGNLPIVEFLTKIDKNVIYMPSTKGVTATQIAFMTKQYPLAKYLYNLIKRNNFT